MKKTELKELYEMMFPNYPDILTVTELREMLGISRHLAYKLLGDGYITAVKIGSAYRIPKVSVIHYVMEGSERNASRKIKNRGCGNAAIHADEQDHVHCGRTDTAGRECAQRRKLANGVPLKQIQDWLGHSDFSTTANIYAHLDYASKLSSAQAMVNGMVLPEAVDFSSKWTEIAGDGEAN